MKNRSIILLLLFLSYSLVAQVYEVSDEDHSMIAGEIAEAIDDYYSYDVSIKGGQWKKGRSSVLIEKGKPEDTYELSKLNDNDLSTAWVEGVKGDGVGEYVFQLVYRMNNNLLTCFKYNKYKKIKVVLEINNGFCKTKTLFDENNCVKQALVQLFDVPVIIGQNNTYVSSVPALLLEQKIDLADSMEKQNFVFFIESPDNLIATRPEILLKFTILDVYTGTAYGDTCISEMHVYGEYDNKE